MTVTEKEIAAIGKLSRIAIAKEDLKIYVSEINQILDLVNELNTAKTENVPPLFHPLDLKARLRKDQVTEDIPLDEKMKSSVEVKNNLFVVPKVID